MAKSIEQEQGRQPADNLWTSIGAGAVGTINAATQKLENLSPRERALSRRAFCIATPIALVGLTLAEWQRQQQQKFLREIKTALASFGTPNVLVTPDRELRTLDQEKIEIFSDSSGRRVYLLNLSGYQIRYDEETLGALMTAAGYNSNALIFYKEALKDVPPENKGKKGDPYIDTLLDYARKQNINIVDNTRLHNFSIDATREDMVKNSVRNLDIKTLSEVEKRAFGIILGCSLSVGIASMFRFAKEQDQLAEGKPNKNVQPDDLTSKRIWAYQSAVWDALLSGLERPIVTIIF